MDEDEKREEKNSGKVGSGGKDGLKEMIVGNRQVSFAVSVVLGLLLFVMEKMLFGGSLGNQKAEL